MNVRELIEMDLQMQEKLLKKYVKELQMLPKGSLYMVEKNTSKDYYFTEPKTRKRKYISKNDRETLEKVRRYKILSISKKRLESNIEAEKALLKKYRETNYSKVLSELPKAYHFDEITINCKETKQFKDEILHTTSIGLKVRSKSEAIIVEILAAEGLAFEYEEELVLKDLDGKIVVRKPDFTFATSRGKKIYWEHFGMLHDEQYRAGTFRKLFLYAHNRILPGTNLFMTADYDDGGLDITAIYAVVSLIKSMI